MINKSKSKHELIEECLRRGLPVTNEDTIETLNLYLKVADHVDHDDDVNDREIFDEMELKRKQDKSSKSFLSRFFSL